MTASKLFGTTKRRLTTALLPFLGLFVAAPVWGDSVIATIPVGDFPYAVVVNPVTNKAYVMNAESRTVTVIDGVSSASSTVAVGAVSGAKSAITLNPVTNKIYVANEGSNTVTVIDGVTNSPTTVATGSRPHAIALNPVTNKIYVANSDTITVIDGTSNSTTTVTVGNYPCDIAVNQTTNKIYTTNSDTITVMDGVSNSTATITGVSGCAAIAVNQTTNKIYVANFFGNTVTVIDGATNSIVTTVAAGSWPHNIAVNSITNKIYVANYTGNVTVIDGDSNSTSTIAAGDYPWGIAINSAINKIYVANYTSNTATVIDGTNNSTTTVTVGAGPHAIALNPNTNLIYVVNRDSDNVSVITGTPTTDTPPPIITSSQSPAANANGWNNSDVTVSFAATDDTSIPSCTVNSVTLTSEGANQVASTTCYDATGNSASASHTVNIDKTAPGLVMPSLASSYLVGSYADFYFDTIESLSGLASSSATLNDGPINSNSTVALNLLGTNTFILTAMDYADNSETQTRQFAVTIDATLTTNKAGTGNGTITSSPAGINCGVDCSAAYSNGTLVNLTAVAESGSTFTGWSGDSDCTDGSVTMTASKTCTATFDLMAWVSVDITPANSGISVGQTLQFTATGTFSDGTSRALINGSGVWMEKAPTSTPRYGAAVAEVNGTLYAVGGYNNSGSLATVEAYDPATDTWSTKASMSTLRYGHTVNVVNGILYAVGGSDGGTNLGGVEAYDPATDTWSAKASWSTPRYWHTMNVVNGILYAVGGLNIGSTPPVEAYDPATDTWSTKASMPTARYGHTVNVVNGILYAVGGYDYNSRAPAPVEAYDPATDTWSTKASMSTPRVYHTVNEVNGILYAVGGNDNGAPAPVEAYDPATDTWSTKASMYTLRVYHTVNEVNGILYAVGGSDGDTNLGGVEAYDPATDSWSTKASMPTARYRHTVNEVNGILYAVGGNDNSGYLGTVEAYTPGEVSWSSSNPSVATIDVNGLAIGLSPGTSEISVSYAGVSNRTNIAIVTDTTPPVLSASPNLTVAATSIHGAIVTYALPTATDNVDTEVAVTCNPASNIRLPVGETLIVCSATDAAGHSASKSFTITVEILEQFPVPVSHSLIPSSTSVELGHSLKLEVETIFSDGSGQYLKSTGATIGTGGGYACAVMNDGTVTCWGDNEYGRLGNGTTDHSATPVAVLGLSSVTAISTGANHSCALRSDGTVWCWGVNYSGQLGNDTGGISTTPVAVPNISSTIAISAGSDYTCALLEWGNVQCWGDNYNGQLEGGPQVGVTAISAGAFHACALLRDGAVKCWGWNGYGQFGNGTTSNSASTVMVSGLGSVISISAGSYHTCATLANGTAKCWGSNGSGQLGNAVLGMPAHGECSPQWGRVDPCEWNAYSATPVEVTGLTSARAVRAGDTFTCAIGGLYGSGDAALCWGYGFGALVESGNRRGGTPTPTPISDVVSSDLAMAIAIETGGVCQGSICALVPDTSYGTTNEAETAVAKCWNVYDGQQQNLFSVAGVRLPPLWSSWDSSVAVVSEKGVIGALRPGLTLINVSYKGVSGQARVDVVDTTPPILNARNLVVVATRAGGEIVDYAPTVTDFDPIVTVACLPASGSTFAWGKTVVTCTAQDSSENSAETSFTVTVKPMIDHPPVSLSLMPDAYSLTVGQTQQMQVMAQYADGSQALDASQVIAISSGYTHSCVLLTYGTVKCWGENWAGQLGDGTSTDSATPVTVSDTSSYMAISANGNRTCGVLTNGTVKCWGDWSTTPAAIPELNSVTAISASSGHTCALNIDGRVACWGYNGSGQLGDGTANNSDIPITVIGLNSVTAISAGDGHTCALLDDGTVKCWGANEFGQLGNDFIIHRYSFAEPVAVTGLEGNLVIAISANGTHTCALLADGTVKCWGGGYRYYRHDGGTLNSVTAISAGNDHDCAVLTDGTVKCWGNNWAGQLGDGTTNDSATPVLVNDLGTTVAAISASSGRTCAALANGEVKCWGATPVTIAGLSDLAWSSSNADVAPVDENGLVTGISPGIATLTFTFGSSSANATATVAHPNQPPIADPRFVPTSEDTTIGITLTGSDPDSDPITFALVTSPTHGALSGTAPNLSYTPDLNYNGPDSFTFTVSDGTLISSAATVSITVAAVNDAPIANNQTVSTREDTAITLTLSGSDAEGSGLTFSTAGLSGPSNGSLSAISNTVCTVSGCTAQVTYTPSLNYNGADSFTFTVSDGTTASAPAMISMTVTPLNDGPVAGPDPVQTLQNVAIVIPAATLLANDTDADGDVLTITRVSNAVNGTVSLDLATATVTFTPNTNFAGTGSFKYTINDGSTGFAVGTVTVTIKQDTDGDGIPDATDNCPNHANTNQLNSDSDGLGNVCDSDDDNDGIADEIDLLSTSYSNDFSDLGLGAGGATYGALLNRGDQSLAVTEEANPVGVRIATALSGGTVPAEVDLCSGQGVFSMGANDEVIFTCGSVIFTVIRGAVEVTFKAQDGTLATTSVSAGNGLTFHPAEGTITAPSTNTQAAVIVVNGETVTIAPGETAPIVNHPPVATAQAVETPEDTPVAITLTGSDPNADPITFVTGSNPAHGTLSGTAPNLIYTPNLNYNGPDSFTFTVSDGVLTSALATVSITVTPVNDSPVANAGSDQTVEATSAAGATVTLSGNASDVDGDPLTYNWTGCFGSATGVNPTVTIPISVCNITLTVSDGTATATDSVQITVRDSIAPSGIIVIAGGQASTATPSVTLTLSCTDSGSGCNQMQLSNDNATFTALEGYTTSKAWSLTSGNGVKTVYVRYTDAAGNVSASVSDTITLDAMAPTAPTGLTAIAVSASQINLTWTAATDNVGVTGYKIESCTGAKCTAFAQVGTATTTSFSNTGLTARITYRYRIRAFDAAGNNSVYSSIVKATTLR